MRWGLLDSIESIEVGERAVGSRTWDPTLPLFLDHFPGFPVVPGVLLLESLAQLSGKLIGYSIKKERGDWPFPILSLMERVKFRRFVKPGQLTRLETELVSLREDMGAVKVRVLVDGKWVARAEQVFAFNAVPLTDPVEQARVEQCERDELARLWAAYPGDF